MSIRKETPCDYGECPYDAKYSCDCEYWCSADPEPYFDEENENCEEEDYDK